MSAPTTTRVPRSLDPTAREVWQAARTPLLIVAVVLLTALGLAIVASGSKAGLLDPRAVDRPGSKAVAQLLRDRGVQVDLVRTTAGAIAADGPDRTLLIAFPDLLVPDQLRRIRASRADLVLIAPVEPSLDMLTPGVRAAGQGDGESRRPRCDLPAAQRAGVAEVAAVLYAVRDGGSTRCYPSDGFAGLVRLEQGGRSITILGDPRPLTNDRLDETGNAALALNLLGGHQQLTWYLPNPAETPESERKSFFELVPDGVKYAAAALVVVLVLLALWRIRRLGPVVSEPLPVVVRGAETVEGRARLYQRARARDRAADALRSAAIARLGPVLALPRGASPETVVDTISSRTGRERAEIAVLLYGAAPADDHGLVRLASSLDALEREVRRS